MKIFALYSTVELFTKPSWFDSFRKKYYGSYDLHVTFKQSCFIKQNEIIKVKQKLEDYFSKTNRKSHEIKMIFNKLIVYDDVIMINSEYDPKITSLQKDLVNLLDEYTDFIEPELEEYQNNFQPHITIAMDLNNQQLIEAQNEIVGDIFCEGVIKDVTLSVVNEITPKETNNPDNKTLYKL